MREQDIYTWPNKAFPFRVLLNSEKCRIFVIENLPHNYEWLKLYKHNIKSTDFFFIILGWNFSKWLAEQSRFIIDNLNLTNENFFILYNCHEEKRCGDEFNLNGNVINHNAWIDESKMKILDVEKKYDALYIARPSPFKNHYLARGIKNLALVAGANAHGEANLSLPICNNDASKVLNKKEICEIINQSKCGLCLSTEEGSCYSSSEYLLCGVPVVSVQSKGGRDVWYSKENSIICEPTEDSVTQAVAKAVSKKWDKDLIRSNHIHQSTYYKNLFIKEIQKVLDRFGFCKMSSNQVFDCYFDWYCRYQCDAEGQHPYSRTSNIDKLAKFFNHD